MINGQNFLDEPVKDDLITYQKKFKRLQLVKEIITEAVVY